MKKLAAVQQRLLVPKIKRIGYSVTEIVALSERNPKVSPEALLAGFHPSYRFGEVAFDTFLPDPAHQSRADAVDRLKAFAASIDTNKKSSGIFSSLFSPKSTAARQSQPIGLCLDGEFGV